MILGVFTHGSGCSGRVGKCPLQTVTTRARRMRLSDPTCLIEAEGHPMPGTKTPARWVSEQPRCPKEHPHGHSKILQWGELCKPCSFQDVEEEESFLAVPRVSPISTRK